LQALNLTKRGNVGEVPLPRAQCAYGASAFTDVSDGSAWCATI